MMDGVLTNGTMTGVFDEWNDDWSSVGWHEGWEQTCDTSASSFSLGGFEKSEAVCRRQIQELRNLHTSVPLIFLGLMAGVSMNGMMARVLMSGMMTGVPLDGTKVGNKRMTLPQAHFRLEVWMSVPPVVRSGSNG